MSPHPSGGRRETPVEASGPEKFAQSVALPRVEELRSVLPAFDACVLWLTLPLAVFTLINGLDELWIDLAWLWFKLSRRREPPPPHAGPDAPQPAIALFVPLWREDDVILEMLARNIACIRYCNYEIFVGAYPNDAPTISAVRNAESRWPNVHLALCPHDGPTSKADCLNWIYQRMLLFEEKKKRRFDVVVVHDAEDVVHADELAVIGGYSGRYDFVQIPVLPMTSPVWKLTHGTYCDDFAQMHMRDLPVRAALGGFIPSAGVGTGYSRRALESLAESESNRIFEPSCLTEDYENGLRLHSAGFRQLFVPLGGPSSRPLATREFFPSSWRAACRQRTRWVTGISMQTWERHGWRPRRQAYWLWRDRKGLLGNPINVVSMLVFVYAAATRMWMRTALPHGLEILITLGLAIQTVRGCVKIGCTWRWFGWFFALLQPVREIYGGVINSWAMLNAAVRFLTARVRGEPLRWLKTEHAYPSRAALADSRPLLGAVLTGSGYVRERDLEEALGSRPPGMRIGEWLVASRRISEDELYEALSLQTGIPLASVEDAPAAASVSRALPARVTRKWQVIPFRISGGELLVAGMDPPEQELESTLRSCVSLNVRFHLITPGDFRLLQQTVDQTLSAG